jgi:thiol-disulfide isomerase/thioredoxin
MKKRITAIILILLAGLMQAAEYPVPATVAENLGRMRITPSTPPAPAPAFSVPLLSGGQARLEDYRGHWLVLNFWATYCAPCRVEMPALDRFGQHYIDQPVRVLAVALDEDREEALHRVAATLSAGFPIALADSSIVAAYRLSALPATFIIDPAGRVLGHALGDRDWIGPQALDLMDSLLASPYHR